MTTELSTPNHNEDNPCSMLIDYHAHAFSRRWRAEYDTESRHFVATRADLLTLANHWARIIFELNYDFLSTGMGDPDSFDRRNFAAGRLDHLASVLGDEVVEDVFALAKRDFLTTIDPEHREPFVSGDAEAWDRIQADFWAKLDAKEQARESAHTPADPRLGSSSSCV